MDDTDYFPDYVETQIRGYDGDGHSVVINAATDELVGVMSAKPRRADRRSELCRHGSDNRGNYQGGEGRTRLGVADR